MHMKMYISEKTQGFWRRIFLSIYLPTVNVSFFFFTFIKASKFEDLKIEPFNVGKYFSK